ALNLNYDCGDFPANQTKALAQSDWAGFGKRRDEAKARGRLRGIGIANPIEKAAGPGQEFAEIRFHPSGNATLLMGSKNQGQGHETTFKQVLNEKLGSIRRPCNTLTATPTASPLASAPTAHARR